MNQAELDELCGFVGPNTRIDVQSVALHHILCFTGTAEGRHMLMNNGNLISSIVKLAFLDNRQKQINKDAFFTLINLSADEQTALKLLKIDSNNNLLLKSLIEYVLDENSKFADVACAILSNLSRGKHHSELIIDSIDQQSFHTLLKVFTIENFNKNSNNMDYLAPFICNLTQLESFRKHLYANDFMHLRRLLPYTTYMRSIIRRGGIIGCLKNCTFDFGKFVSFLLSITDQIRIPFTDSIGFTFMEVLIKKLSVILNP
jgi:hypothetical protein